MPAPQISALPQPPSRTQPGTFAARADAFLGSFPQFRSQANALATFVNDRADEVDSNTEITRAARDAAINAANATRWRKNTSYMSGDITYSPKTFQTYRSRTSHSGSTVDPADDATNWVQLSVNNLTITTEGGTIDGGELIIRKPPDSSHTLVLGEESMGEVRFHHGEEAFQIVRRKNGVTNWGAALTQNNNDGKWRIGSGTRDDAVLMTKAELDARFMQSFGDVDFSGTMLLEKSGWLQMAIAAKSRPNTGLYFAQVGDAFMPHIAVDGVHSATFEKQGISANHLRTVMTREKSDARYINRTGGSMTGPLHLPAGSVSNPALKIGHSQDGLVWETGLRTLFIENHSISSELRNNNVHLPNPFTIVKREGGDARYVRSGTHWENHELILTQRFWNNVLRIHNNDSGASQLSFTKQGSRNFRFDLRADHNFGVWDATGNTQVARFDPSNVSDNNPLWGTTVMTRNKGDARYARLGAGDNNFAGGAIFNGRISIYHEGNQTWPSIRLNDNNTGIWAVDSQDDIRFTVDGTLSGIVENGSAHNLKSAYSLVTRAKGDDRYVTQQGGPDDIGQYGLFRLTLGSALNTGDNVGGANLRRTDADNHDGGGTPSGTWKCMSMTYSGSVGLFKRIA